MIVHLLNFNNYYNRTYKPLSSNDDYQANIVYIPDNDVNFNPNDGVNTVLVMNMPSMFDDKANYLVTVENGEITSRWFIIDAERTRLNQYQMTLRRDLLADYFDDITNAPTFIEKATVKYGNPLLFNSEEITFNQVKTKETPLRDNTGSAWIVGYLDAKAEAKNITAPTNNSISYKAEYASLADLPFYTTYSNADNTFRGNVNNIRAAISYQYKIGFPWTNYNKIVFNELTALNEPFKIDSLNFIENGKYNGVAAATELSTRGQDAIAAMVMDELKEWYAGNTSTITETIRTALNLASDAETEEFLNTYTEEGTIYKVGNKFYKCRRSNVGSSTLTINPASKDDPAYLVFNDDMIPSIASLRLIESKPNVAQYEMRANYTGYKIFIEEVKQVSSYTVNVAASGNRTHLEDAPYDMFAIPYPINRKLDVSTNDVTNVIAKQVIPEASMAIAAALIKEYGDALYDIQLLPYCPIQDMAYRSTILINDDIYSEGRDYSPIKYSDGSTSVGCSVLLWCRRSEFSLNINKISYQTSSGERLEPITIPVDAADAKVQALCDMYRLVSPNYNGQFEFNAVKNNGVEYFQVDCSYKPYSPYIRVSPNFKGLYGADFNDARGLICGGDFSLPTITDQWKQYEINNKNYLNAFNRQIESMEINNKYQRVGETLGAVAGTLGGSVSGASTGFIASGSPYGAIAGAAVGGVVSGTGGVADIAINDKLRSEALDLTRDQFGYSLGNIRALPYTLNRVSSFNINNKIFPILEYYTCSDTEKQALRDKITYNGMTVGVIGTVAEYVQDEPTYIKGRLIRLEGLDNHTTTEIANELNKGFYI